jgi:hypothetical protein
MEILNKTKRPLRVPLPGGKQLHLGPGKTGQISPKAADHPALKKLVDQGEIELLGGGHSQGKGASGDHTPKSPPSDVTRRGIRYSGDR